MWLLIKVTTNKFAVAFFVAGLLFSILLAPSKTIAISGSDWRAGNIISDDVFYDNTSMTTADIQHFLNAMNPNCSAGYTCLKMYIENPTTHQNNYSTAGGGVNGGWSAAQIIKGAADAYRISPKTLIVMLQKEQSLITITNPGYTRYRSAMGYGCPDTAPCDAEYYGFYNQVYKAAYQFRYYVNYSTKFRHQPYRNNSVLYNPDGACGSSSIYIENYATAGLYNYTPYQPNTAALNNLYGSGNTCSAYGNRNFWRIFNDWFGSTWGVGYSFVSAVNPPTSMTNNQTSQAQIKIKNSSGLTWYSDGNVPSGKRPTRLMTQGYANSPFADPSRPEWLGTRNQVRMVEASVPHGQTATFNVPVRAGFNLTTHTDKFNPVTDGVKVYPGIGMQWTVSNPQASLSYSVVDSGSMPKTIQPGQKYSRTVKLRNTGNFVWKNESSVFATRLATWDPAYNPSVFYTKSDTNWLSNNQIRMQEASVAPGQTGTFTFLTTAPTDQQIYTESYSPVIDGYSFYPHSSALDISTRVASYSYSIISSSISSNLEPGQATTLTVALKNTGSAIWYSDSNVPDGEHPFRLATSTAYTASNFADRSDPAWLGTNNQIRMQEASVAPGQTGTFVFRVVGPYIKTTQTTNFAPVVDGLMFLYQHFPVKFSSTASANLKYSFVSVTNQPSRMQPNQTSKVSLSVKNTGNATWYNDQATPFGKKQGIRLAMINPYYRNSLFADRSDPAWLGTNNQISMATPSVPPGQIATFTFNWKAPSTATPPTTDAFTLVSDGYAFLPNIGMQFVTTVQ